MLIIKEMSMELYKIGSTLLDISLGFLLLGALLRMILTFTYFKRNGSRTLTDEQRKKIKNWIIPTAVIAILLGIASIIFNII